jgi:uncharacterized protein YndB with AHSA1/START domain
MGGLDRSGCTTGTDDRQVQPPAGLAYTFRWDPPDPADRETVVTLTLHERDGGTELVLIQGEFAMEARLVLHEGWTESLERLEQVLVEAQAAEWKGSSDKTTVEEASK